jgi:DNA invertase Pin-like site-specific DNA recombinase
MLLTSTSALTNNTCVGGVMAKTDRNPATLSAQHIPLTIHRVALYARVSTRDQNCELQLGELRPYAERRSWQIVDEYVDRGISGSKDSRPQLNRLMDNAHQRKFDAIVVWKIDRFGRSLKHLVTALADLAAYGVAFVSLRDNMDLSTPSGRLMFHVVAAMAEFERELIRERVRSGIANARAKGVTLGRRKVSVDAATVARLRSEGCSWAEVCRSLNLSKGTAQRAFYSSAQLSPREDTILV